MVVPEASARGENFNVDEKADHFSICRPKNKKVRSFKKLEGFLADIVSEMKVRGFSSRQCKGHFMIPLWQAQSCHWTSYANLQVKQKFP